MGSNRWSNKADVLEDLMNATGGRVRNLDSSYFVIGEQAPPRLHCDIEDDEMRLLFGGSVNAQDFKYEVMAPDLQGITKLIRLVEDYDKPDDENDNGGSTDSESLNHIISISKLNPNVKEFVPTLGSTSSSVLKIDDADNNISLNIVNSKLRNASNKEVVKYDEKMGNKINSFRKEAVNLHASTASSSDNEKYNTVNDVSLNIDDKKTTIVCNEVNVTNDEKESNQTNSITYDKVNEAVNSYATTSKLDVANLKPNQIQIIAAELKNKIVGRNNIASMSTFEMKRQRNVAIANLQKLFSKPLATNNCTTVENVNKPSKLITPEYYEKCKSSDVPKENKSEKKAETIISSILHLKINCDDSLEAAKLNCNQMFPASSEDCDKRIVKTISLDAGIQNENIALMKKGRNLTVATCSSDPQIRDSIKKVNSWLYKTDDKPKPVPLCLNPVAFKRKDTNNCKSPNGSAEKKVAKSNGVIEEYKPSAYADELMKTYMERANVAKQKQKLTLSNLHVFLKEKDEQIRDKNANRSVDCNELNISHNA